MPPSTIRFFNQDIAFKLTKPRKTKAWLAAIAETEGYSVQEINYIFTSDRYLLQVNQRFLKHDTFTDIITFDNSDQEGIIEADIYISIPRVRENARHLQEPFEEELRRVLVHGLLHLVGFKDKTKDQKKRMRQREDVALSDFA